MNQAQVEAITDRFKDKVVVSLEENDWRNMAEDYKCAFVLKLANGMPFNLTGPSNVLTKVWNMENRVTFTELANNMALAKFKNKSDMQKIRDGGPWLCLGTFIVMHDWCPDLSPEEFEMNRLRVWAQLHNLHVGAVLKDKAIGEKLAIYRPICQVGQLLGQEIWNAKGINVPTMPQPNRISGLDNEKAHSTSGVEVPVQYYDNWGGRLMRKDEDHKRRKLPLGRFHPYRVSDCDLEAKKSEVTQSNDGVVSTILEIPAVEVEIQPRRQP
ncbi:hypothetical protein QQ045_000256 [Rhodiola kirilowii]